MAANRIFSRFAELLDIATSRAAATWIRLNTDGTHSERTAAQTLSDIGAAASADLASKANIADPTFTGTVTAENLVFGGLTMYGPTATFTYLGSAAATQLTALGLSGAPAKLGFISVTQAVDLDQMESDIAAMANGMVYKDDWDASAGTFPGAGVAQIGWFYNVSVAGTVDGVEFAIGDSIIAKADNASTTTYAANWTKKDQTDAVQTVAGRVGNVVITTSDLADFDSSVAANSAVAANTAKISATIANIASAIFGATAKTTPVDADSLAITDSADSNAGKKVTWANIKATLKTYFDTLYALAAHTHTGQIQVEVGNGVDVITTGVKTYFRVPYGWTINGAYVTGSPSGSIVFDIWKDTVSTDPETDVTVADTITASAKPTLSSDTYSADTTLTGWTTTGTAGQWMAVKVDSAATITKATLTLSLTRT